MSAWVAWLCVLVSICGDVEPTMDGTTAAQINGGLAMGEKITEGLSKFGNVETDKLFRRLHAMSGFLGAAGGLVSFALLFLPKQESAELRYMKEQFSKVNMKLDIITNELDHIEDLIILENQRSQYITKATSILFGYEQMNLFINELASIVCSTAEECLRQRTKIAESYVGRFDVEEHMYAILHGSVESVSVFGEPLLDLIKTTYKCNIGKINKFANGVLKLVFKSQQVILTHEKLTGTNTSILASMNRWLELVYVLRKKVDQVKNNCYLDITSYMINDIKLVKYQSDYDNNQEASDAIKRDLSSKYPWLYWLAYAYGAYGGDHHWTSNKEGAFWNIPTNKEDRKRNVIIVPQDKGDYLDQRGLFAEAIEAIAGKKITVGSLGKASGADELYTMMETELKKRGAWRLLKSFTILRDYDNLKVAVDENHELFWFNEEVSLTLRVVSNNEQSNNEKSVLIRVIAVLRSQAELKSLGCGETCNHHGVCRLLPYSTQAYCECDSYYQGEHCENRVRAKLALDMEKMLAVTFRIPKISDVYFEIKDLSVYLASSINKVLSAGSELGNQVKKSFEQLNERLTDEFQWAKLLTIYSDTITDLSYAINNVPNLASYELQVCTNSDTKKKKVPTATLR